jgi:hypothetical protein
VQRSPSNRPTAMPTLHRSSTHPRDSASLSVRETSDFAAVRAGPGGDRLSRRRGPSPARGQSRGPAGRPRPGPSASAVPARSWAGSSTPCTPAGPPFGAAPSPSRSPAPRAPPCSAWFPGPLSPWSRSQSCLGSHAGSSCSCTRPPSATGGTPPTTATSAGCVSPDDAHRRLWRGGRAPRWPGRSAVIPPSSPGWPCLPSPLPCWSP